MSAFRLLTVGAAIFFASRSASLGQGTVVFNNSSTTRITNCYTRLPQTNTVYVGLYFTTDLSAVTNQSALEDMLLAGTPKLLPATANPAFRGIFAGNNTTLPGVPAESWVVLRVKIWPTNYATFDLAFVNGAEVAQSLPWVQKTGGGIAPPSIIRAWGFRPFLYPQCELARVPLTIERGSNNVVRVNWPVGVPPNLQVRDGSSTNWQSLTSGTFVQDHWEFQLAPADGAQFFRLGN